MDPAEFSLPTPSSADRQDAAAPHRGKLAEIKTKTDLVYDYLEAALLDGDLKAGERLNADAIARDLGISKIPVREALQRLTNMGVITHHPYSGPIVVASSEVEVEAMHMVRGALEGLIAELAAPLITDEQIEVLDAVTARMRALTSSNQHKKLTALNREFHMTIAAASGYRLFAELSHMLLLRGAHYRAAFPAPPEVWMDIIEEHEKIVAALRLHDAKAAKRAATKHVTSRLNTERQAIAARAKSQ